MTRFKEAKWCACLLAHGPIPEGPSAELYEYKRQVRAWWKELNKHSEPPIKIKAVYAFWNNYHHWYNNLKTLERRQMRCAMHIVTKWTK